MDKYTAEVGNCKTFQGLSDIVICHPSLNGVICHASVKYHVLSKFGVE